MTATDKQDTRGVVEIARELVAAMAASRAELIDAEALAAELYEAASGDAGGDADPRIERFGYALGEDAKSWAPTYLRDSELIENVESAITDARELLELAEIACSPREAVAS